MHPGKHTVENVMVESVLVTNVADTVAKARETMKGHRVHALPVVDDDGALLGIVTATDLLADDVLPQWRIEEIMQTPVYTVERGDPVDAAARTMRTHRIHHLVVIANGTVYGMLSSFDLLLLLEKPIGDD